MTRRTMLVSVILAVFSGAGSLSSRAAAMVERARKRWQRGSSFADCSRLRRLSTRRGVELCRSLERAVVPPDMREVLRQDLGRVRAGAVRDAQQAEHYARLAAKYRRAALRPWRPLPPDPHRKA
jgi:hypothetical protein